MDARVAFSPAATFFEAIKFAVHPVGILPVAVRKCVSDCAKSRGLPNGGLLLRQEERKHGFRNHDKKENKTCFSSFLRIDKNIVTIVTIPRVIRIFKRLSGDDPGDDVVTMVTMFLAVLGHSLGRVGGDAVPIIEIKLDAAHG